MLGSIFLGLGGMNAFSNALRQISNNITNINSTGFKASTLRFLDLTGRDGRSGEGVMVAESRLNFAQGELRQTDRDLDFAVDGEGFLVVLNEAGEQFLTRTGSFDIQENGDIVIGGTQYRLTTLNEAGIPAAASIQSHRLNPPQPTTRVTFADNLSSSASSPYTVSNIPIFSAQGQSANWTARFERNPTAGPGEWTLTVTEGGAEVGQETLKFIGGIVDPATSQLTFQKDGQTVTFDLSAGVTSFSSGEVSTLRASDNDGYGIGEISGVTITDQGQLQVSYSNEQKVDLGAVTLAHVRDPQSLTQRDGGLFVHDGAGAIEFLSALHQSVGRIAPRRLEASNVDLSQQFGDLILVQRGYQASSQVVSVSNEMIQQLFGIKGQG